MRGKKERRSAFKAEGRPPPLPAGAPHYARCAPTTRNGPSKIAPDGGNLFSLPHSHSCARRFERRAMTRQLAPAAGDWPTGKKGYGFKCTRTAHNRPASSEAGPAEWVRRLLGTKYVPE